MASTTSAVLIGIAAGAALTAGHIAHGLAAQLADARYAASHDPLTGLLNRNGFDRAGSQALAEADEFAAVVLFDLDRFKPVNDEHGHDVGDEVLAEVALRIEGVVGQRGVVARLGGDEFAAVLDSTAEVALRILADVRAVVRLPVHVGDLVISVDVSAGVAAGRPGDQLGVLLRAADLAMYEAKRHGNDWSAQQAGRLAVESRPPIRTRDIPTRVHAAS